MLIITIAVLIHIIIAQDCGINPPQNSTDCSIRHYDAQYCCYIYKDSFKTCKLVDANKYNDNPNLFYYNETVFNMKCDMTIDTRVGSPCGVDKPTQFTECNEYSTNTNKCCYYQTNSLTTCFWLGETFTSQTVTLPTETGNIICEAGFLRMNIFIMLYVLIFMY
jgi:hypothetical protein